MVTVSCYGSLQDSVSIGGLHLSAVLAALILCMSFVQGQSATGQSAPMLSDDECWAAMPKAESGGGVPLPYWARAVAVHMPRTAAAMLPLDYAHRKSSPVPAQLRAILRWVVADSNQCEYSRAVAAYDLEQAGGDPGILTTIDELVGKCTPADARAVSFVRMLTISAPAIPDSLFVSLRKDFGDQATAAMVMLAAYGNFQDRLVLGLQLPAERPEAMGPLQVKFADDAFQLAPVLPESAPAALLQDGQEIVDPGQDWATVSWDQLQQRLERQRSRTPRLPIPTWDEVRPKLPERMRARPTRILWNLINYGYVPELSVPWSAATRTMWSEAPGDRVFEESLFWVQTRTIQCNYCMGHCEMLLEVAGLNKQQVDERTRALASDNWAPFSPSEQRTFAYARKLTAAPSSLTFADYQQLEADLGDRMAMSTFWWLCRGLYMTRISDGFQLPLERENVFEYLRK